MALRKKYEQTPIGRAELSAVEPEARPVDGLLWLDTAGSSGSSGVMPIRTETANYTAVQTDSVILGDATSGSITITLPPAASNPGKVYYIKKIDGSVNTVTVDGDGSETIDDDTTLVITAQYDAPMIVSDGTEWWVI